jgi:hypothetical protein
MKNFFKASLTLLQFTQIQERRSTPAAVTVRRLVVQTPSIPPMVFVPVKPVGLCDVFEACHRGRYSSTNFPYLSASNPGHCLQLELLHFLSYSICQLFPVSRECPPVNMENSRAHHQTYNISK